MFQTLFYFIFALMLLIVVHEMGHFLVARLCGVKVLRFSFGFGKVFLKWKSKRGTEFVWSLIPLGGYVKMLDESEEPVAENERHLAFNNKSVWARMAIILAGPMFNFLFAIIALWLMWCIGINTLAPIVESVRPGSPAELAGLKPNQEIIAFNEKEITSWHDFQYALMPFIGANDSISLKVRSLNDKKISSLHFSLDDWNLNTKKPDILETLGIKPFIPKIPPIVGEVVAESPAYTAGLKPDDIILSIAKESVTDWLILIDFVRAHPKEIVPLTFKRNNQIYTTQISIGEVKNGTELSGFIGLKSKPVDWPENWLRSQRKSPGSAFTTAITQAGELTATTFTLIGRLLVGKLPIQSLSGPVGIAQSAGESGKSGIAYYLSFLALVSISLGVLNLLPIPVLDGGHLFYCIIEVIRGKPLSDEVKSAGIYVGLVVLLALMVIALKNDISRLVG